MRFVIFFLLAMIVTITSPVSPAGASGMEDLTNTLKEITKPGASQQPGQSGSSLTNQEVDSGLREALQVAVKQSLDTLGTKGGYLDNALAFIPMPESLSMIDKGLRAAGQGALVDDFVASMNHAAEKAVPETADIFGNAISAMTMEDGRAILSGSEDAATKYFEKTSRTQLKERVMPIISQSLQEAKVVQYYEAMMQGAATFAPMLGQKTDLKEYVSEKGLDGLFNQMAEYEQKIRDNPAFRTTSLLQKVFGQ